jgi:hypothetical protein
MLHFAGVNTDSIGALASRVVREVQKMERADLPFGQQFTRWGQTVPGVWYDARSVPTILVVAFALWLPCCWALVRLLRRGQNKRIAEALRGEQPLLDSLGVPS